MAQKPSWLFWVVAVFGLLWNGFGAYDLVMTTSGNEAYLSQYTPEQLAYWEETPSWRVVVWIIGIVTAVAAAVLFVARQKLAVPLYAVAPPLMVIGILHDVTQGGPAVMGPTLYWTANAVVLGVQVALLLYARRQRRLGVLR